MLRHHALAHKYLIATLAHILLGSQECAWIAQSRVVCTRRQIALRNLLLIFMTTMVLLLPIVVRVVSTEVALDGAEVVVLARLGVTSLLFAGVAVWI